MTNINLNTEDGNVTYQMPDSWNDINIETFSKIIKFNNIYKDKEIGMMENIKVISILTDIPIEVLYELEPTEFNQLAEQSHFIREDLKYKTVDYIIIDDVKYYLKKDFDNFNMGELASIDTIQKKYNNNIDEALAELLCIFLRRKKEDGTLEKFKVTFMERVDIFNKAKITEVGNIMNFFLDGNKDSKKTTKNSSKPVSKENKKGGKTDKK